MALGVAGALAGAQLSGTAGAEAPQASTTRAPSVPACRFTQGDTDAYAFESVVTVDAGGAHAERDRFAGVLSWVVVEAATGERPALLRASITHVELEQSLTPEPARARASELAGQPFFVRIDETCRFAGIGFGASVRPVTRELVTTLLEGAEIALPGDARDRWEAEQRDGVGEYTARYTLAREVGSGALRIRREKPGYHEEAEALRAGIRVQVLEAAAEARFDPTRPGWMQRFEGREHVRFELPGAPARGMVHQLAILRDGGRYVAVGAASSDEADFERAHLESGDDAPVDPALAALGHEEALALFLERMRAEGAAGTYPAARLLADWLRAHPEGSAQLLADLRAGAIDAHAHAALFLALQLVGDEASRAVLVEATLAADLAEVDRARAAVALADHGEPTREAADVLLAQVREGESPDVANVSLLGLGRMAGRAEEGSALREELRATLRDELERAADVHDEIAVVEALGNTRDASFEGALEERLHADDARVRAHAAHALEHMPAERARPRLVEQLEGESSSEVRMAILRSLRGIDGEPGRESGPRLDARELELAARLLATSDDAAVRAGVIDWLGRSAEQPEARAVLAAHFPSEPVLQLKQRIGAFVSAAELRGAVR